MQEVLPLPQGTQIFNLLDYETVGVIGRGGFGEVSRVKNIVSGELYAIKKLLFRSEIQRDAAANEIEIVTTLNHENLLGCLGLYSAPGEIRILMELMESDMSKFRSRDDKVLAGIAGKMLSGLRYLKQNSLLHLDIKPHNLLCRSGVDVIKLADFGSVVKLSTGPKHIYKTGTRSYGAPEIYCNSGITVGPTSPTSVFACDVFSFGIAMLQMFEGKIPVTSKLSAWYLVDQNRFHLPHFITDPSENFQSFLGCCLHKDPTNRFTVEQLLAHPFITELPIDMKGCAQRWLAFFLVPIATVFPLKNIIEMNKT
ncbi:hypothetical protein OROGR_012721 [Orobanche gracilis]